MSKLLIAGTWVDGASVDTLRDKYSGRVFGTMAVASSAQIGEAVTAAVAAVTESSLTPYDRYEILMAASRLVAERRDLFCGLMRDEAGFTRADGENEVQRCVQTLQLSAEEAKRLNGDLVPMHAGKGVKDRIGFTIHAPRGVICAITPFNSPLNTVAHKVGPALAGGNSVVLKPSNHTPLSAVELCRALLDAGLPPRLLTLIHGRGSQVGRELLADQRIAYYAFTGSTEVGREIQQAAGLRGTQLELGSIASTIVCEDADTDMAIPKILNAGFRKAGQVCTSVQRLLIDRRIYDDFVAKLVTAVAGVKAGDPGDPQTLVGPMISQAHAERAEQWICEAIEGGAKVLAGGTRDGSVLAPTVLADVSETMRVYCSEIFAPVISVIPFDGVDDAVVRANDSPYGLAAGLFTANLHVALRLAPRLRFGGVHVNEASSARADVMPFGGVKDSGFGREGPAYAIREMTEERLITIAY
ncbi:aldehyde dehydrogenase family protein [Sphingomonadaceae bacterium G21617-S1]|jgi:succinate-semialdehyde dehydrogenase/glutarate-semialdehyde dehydrogenase|uniref:aldehyde dehydrogenase family protein n=1 Tax=Rhizorhabdus sp. TaxID=1968843 RepID=UPI0019B0E200|nr:aldehyde dehydrogenase family protein [Rhizorhabdus sp.]MBD3760999.1 aldehyde dehydrogenase family protein [Rhizorhabdus sp.]MCZ4341179.1 aldehyde dehydrogenase family protein [Sphingomonadaceae bacterium G21617-S1]